MKKGGREERLSDYVYKMMLSIDGLSSWSSTQTRLIGCKNSETGHTPRATKAFLTFA